VVKHSTLRYQFKQASSWGGLRHEKSCRLAGDSRGVIAMGGWCCEKRFWGRQPGTKEPGGESLSKRQLVRGGCENARMDQARDSGSAGKCASRLLDVSARREKALNKKQGIRWNAVQMRGSILTPNAPHVGLMNYSKGLGRPWGRRKGLQVCVGGSKRVPIKSCRQIRKTNAQTSRAKQG